MSLTTIDGRPSCPRARGLMSEYSTVLGITNHTRTTTACAIVAKTGETAARTFRGVSPYESDDWVPPITLGAGTAPTYDVAMAKHRGAAAIVSPRCGRAPKRPPIWQTFFALPRAVWVSPEANHPALRLRPLQKAREFAF